MFKTKQSSKLKAKQRRGSTLIKSASKENYSSDHKTLVKWNRFNLQISSKAEMTPFYLMAPETWMVMGPHSISLFRKTWVTIFLCFDDCISVERPVFCDIQSSCIFSIDITYCTLRLERGSKWHWWHASDYHKNHKFKIDCRSYKKWNYFAVIICYVYSFYIFFI